MRYLVPLVPRAQIEKDIAEGKIVLVNGWVVEDVGRHNCAGGTSESNGAHEPWCGTAPIARLIDLLAPEE